MAKVKARIVANPNVRAKQVSIGASSVNLATKSIQELSDVEATETNKVFFNTTKHQTSGKQPLLLMVEHSNRINN